MQNPLILISALGLINLAGCASTKEAVLPQDGPSMKAIYEGHIQEMNAQDPLSMRQALGDRPILSGDSALHGLSAGFPQSVWRPMIPRGVVISIVAG